MNYPPEIQKLIDDTNAKHEAQSGHSRLWGWFGLSYASFLVLPRIMMHAMPDDWQKRMAILLEEYVAAYPSHPADECRVRHIKNGRMAKWPEWLLDYRHPAEAEIKKSRTVRE